MGTPALEPWQCEVLDSGIPRKMPFPPYFPLF
jgi:hypothetical protein